VSSKDSANTGSSRTGGSTAPATDKARTGSGTSAPSPSSAETSFDAALRGTDQKGSGKAGRGASRTPAKKDPAESARTAKAAKKAGGPRKVRLTLSRIDPFSVMKLSFLAAIAFGIALVVAVALVWNVLDVTGVWDSVDKMGRDLTGGKPLPFMEYLGFTKMVSYATVAAVADIVIITALGTLLAFLYNIVATLLGGLKVTFTDE
jgi:hypothetical protein